MSRLVSGQLSEKGHKKCVCDYCLNSFGTEDLLNNHSKYCSKHDAVDTILPEPGKNYFLKFKNIQSEVECPIKVYADFESFLEPIEKTSGNTKLYQKHVPFCFCFYMVSRVGSTPCVGPITCAGENAGQVFVEKLEKLTKIAYKNTKDSVPMIFDEEAREQYDSQHFCYACGKEFKSFPVELKKVRDHCHYTQENFEVLYIQSVICD